MNHLDAIALMSATCDMNTPPVNIGLEEKFKVSEFPADSFKKYINTDVSLFTAFKEVKTLG